MNFTERYESHKRFVIRRTENKDINSYFKHKMDRYKTLKGLTKFIDYECNFDEAGVCKNYIKGSTRGSLCCCGHCAGSMGYLHIIHEDDIDRYNKSFDRTRGFWRRGKGCILPRKLRSATCVCFNCHDEMFNSMDIFEDVMRDIRKEIIKKYKKEVENVR